MFRFQTPKHNY